MIKGRMGYGTPRVLTTSQKLERSTVYPSPYHHFTTAMPDVRTGIVTSVGKMAKTITVTTRTMNPVPKLLVVCPPPYLQCLKANDQSVPHTNKYLVHDEANRTYPTFKSN